jgi:hypothetical protein
VLLYFRKPANIPALECTNLSGGLLDKVEGESLIESIIAVVPVVRTVFADF